MIRFNNIKIRKDLEEDEILDYLCKKERLYNYKKHNSYF